MNNKAIHVAVTGGSGQIAYSLLFRIASGEMFGKDQPVALSLLELPQAMDSLTGVIMELQDGCFPLLQEIKSSDDPYVAFENVDLALLVGSKPRGPGMERGDLLTQNGKIFVEQGKALNKVAKKSVTVLVVGNPCNTNALIALHNAPDIPPRQFHAMTRLDQNRATFQLAQKMGLPLSVVNKVFIWGNHSATQVPDFTHAEAGGKKVVDIIQDRKWLENDFVQEVQKRGAKIIQARGKSSAASAASAMIDHIFSLHLPLKEIFSSAVYSAGNPYGIDEDLIFSFPLKANKPYSWEIISGFSWDDFIEEKIGQTEKELIQERDIIKSFL